MKKLKEQRRELRFPNSFPIKLIVDNRIAYKGIIKDIGQKGAFVITKGPFRIGQKLILDFRSSEMKYERKKCSVKRSVPDGIGILFD